MKIPVAIIRLLNPLVAGVLRSPLHPLMSGDTMILTVTGRKTGNAYTFPISYVRDGERVRCFTHSRWSRNLRGGADVTMRIAGEEWTGRAEAIEGDLDRVSEGITDFLERVPRDLPYYDVQLGLDGRPVASDVRRAAETTTMIEIRLR